MTTRMQRRPVETTDDNFKTLVLNSAHPVLVDFWAPWCNPCLALAPVMDRLAAAYAGKITVAKCNVDSNPDVSGRFGIHSIPTMILFDRGRTAARIVGLSPVDRIEAAIDRALSDHRDAVTIATD